MSQAKTLVRLREEREAETEQKSPTKMITRNKKKDEETKKNGKGTKGKLKKKKANNVMNREQEEKDPRTFNEAMRRNDAKTI